MSEIVPKTRRIFKRFRLGELSLVDEGCIPGSDVVVVKAKNSTGRRESDIPDDNELEAGGLQFGSEEVRKGIRSRLEPFGALNDALAAKDITVAQFVGKAKAMVAALESETQQAGEPVHKMAAATAASIIAEHTMDLEQIQKALEKAQGDIETVTKRNGELETANAALTADVAKFKKAAEDAAEEVTKAKSPAAEPTEEEVLKALPGPLRDIVIKAKATTEAAEKAADKAVLDTVVAKAKKAGVAEPDKVGEAMVAVKKSLPDHFAVLDAALETAGRMVADSPVLKSLGITPDATLTDANPEAQLQAMGDEIAKAKKITPAAGYAEALETSEGQKLYGTMIAKRR